MKKYLAIVLLLFVSIMTASYNAYADELENNDIYISQTVDIQILDSEGRSISLGNRYSEQTGELTLLPEKGLSLYANGQDVINLDGRTVKINEPITFHFDNNGYARLNLAVYNPSNPKVSGCITKYAIALKGFPKGYTPQTNELAIDSKNNAREGDYIPKHYICLNNQHRYMWEYFVLAICAAAFIFFSFYIAENSVKIYAESKYLYDKHLSDSEKESKINACRNGSLVLFLAISAISVFCAAYFPYVNYAIPFFGMIISLSIPAAVLIAAYNIFISLSNDMLN